MNEFEKYFGRHKDLKIGDRVRYENVRAAGGTLSGEGEVIGFGRFGETDLVWIKKEDGSFRGAPYETVTKL